LRANPRYRLLVLAEQGCRLYEGRFTGLSEVTTDGFPVASAPMAAGQARSHRLGRERSDRATPPCRRSCGRSTPPLRPAGPGTRSPWS